MSTVVLGPRPPELQALLDRRRECGLDGYDEVWEGVYVMAPFATGGHGFVKSQLVRRLDSMASAAGLTPGDSFNIGTSEDFRVRDAEYHSRFEQRVWYDTAALVLEALSPAEDPEAKLPFYAAHDVLEVVVVDPAQRGVQCWQLIDGEFAERERSALLDVETADLASTITWP